MRRLPLIRHRPTGSVDGTAARSALPRRRLLTSLVLGCALALGSCIQRDVITVTVGTVTVSPRSTSLQAGDTLTYEATVSDSEGRALNRAPVEWVSESPEIFSIDSDGTGLGVATGTAVIRASFRGVTGTALVTVVPSPRLTVTPDSAIFYGAAGSPSPAPIALIVGGGGLTGVSAEVTFAEGEPADWLTASLGSTRAPTALTLGVESETLPVGSYNATVAVSSTDDRRGPLFIPVELVLSGFSVTQTGGASTVGEQGPTDSLLVVLDSRPDTDVVLDVTSADPTEVTAAPAALTFTPSTWNLPQVVVLTGEDELVSDGDQETDVAISVNVDASDSAFDPIPARQTVVTTVDDDVPSFTIAETDGSSSVDESGTTDRISVVLDVEPLSPVALNVSWSDSTEVSAGPATLTFTSADWATPQFVTLTGVDDSLLDGTQSTTLFVSVLAAASDDAFDGLSPVTATVTTVDDDVAQFAVREIGPLIAGVDSTVVTEAGSSDQFTIVLEAQPGSDVVMSVVSSDPGEATVSPGVVVFNTGNWNSPAVVTVTGVDDALLDGDQGTSVTISIDDANSDDPFDGLPDVVVGVLTRDDDVADIILLESAGNTTVNEGGSTDAFTVALGAQPLSTVVLDITSGDTGEVTVSSPSLTFTTDNWSTAQSVTVTGIDESIDDGDQVTNVTISVNDAASDDDFDDLPDEAIAVTTLDNDAAGFTIRETGSGTLVSEAGSTDDVGIVLNSEPIDDVVLTLLASDGGEASVAPTSLTFTAANWDEEQLVTVTGVNDLDDDGDQFTIIAVAVSEALSDAAYDPVSDQTIQVTTTDDDSPPGFTINAIGGTLVTEAGGTDNFTVRLDTEPLGTVVLDISTSDAGEASVSPETLSFTSANWTENQTVTVTGVDDDLIDGTQSTTITVSVNDAASDANFDPLPDETLIAETSDDDTAGFVVVESDGTTIVSEGGSTDAFTVALTAQPFSDVVISTASGDLGEVTVTPPTLTFTPSDWDTPQPVTATGADDPVIDGSQTTLVTLSIVDGSSDNNFDAVVDQTVSVQTTDNDQPGISVAESGGGTLVTEAGGTDDFTVVLDSEPTSAVVLDIVSLDIGEATVVPATLTFTPANWDTPRSVVVTGIDDALIDGDVMTTITVSVDDAASDDAYDPVPDETVTVTTTDDDGAGFIITESGGSTLVSEAGATDDFTVVLTAQPASAVRIDVQLSDPSEVSANPVQLTFTGATWNVPQSVVVTGVDDNLTDGSQVSTLTVGVNVAGSDDAYDLLPDQTIDVTTTDDDLASFVVVETGGGTLVSESGGQDDFSIVLGTQPATDVVLDVVGSDIGEAALSPTTLTFTSATWDVAQVVTVTGVNDAVIDGNQSSTATISVNALSDPDFTALPPQVVTITTTDDDAAGVSVTETDNSTRVTEAGSTDSISVVLTSEPGSPVVVDIASDDTSEATVSPVRLTFTPADWSVIQTVVVTGVDEVIDDGNQTTGVSVIVDDAASDDEYDVIADQVVNVTTIDDDVAGFTVTESDGATLVSEGGLTDILTVVLDTEPVANVVLTVTANDVGEATAAPISLVFTPADWATPQTVTVTGVDDFIDDGDVNSTITIAIDAPGSDDAFDSVLPEVVTVTTTDNDAPVGITVTAIGITMVTESGGTDDFTVVLDAQPGTNVVLTVASADIGEVTVAPTTLTFTNGNWNTPQTVTVTGADDDVIDGTQITTVTVAVDPALSDDAYDPAAPATVDVSTTDDDVAGFTLSESDGSTVVNESGTTDSVMVVLDAEPASGVVITASSGNTLEATIAPASLTFTPANWDTPQAFTVTGVDDLVIDFTQVTVLTFGVDAGASDDDFDGVANQTINATTTDDDAAGITISESGGSTEVTEAGSTDSFTVALNRGPATNVIVNVSSGDTGEATVAPIVLTFTPANWFTPQAVTVTGVDDPAVDGDQVTTVTIAVDDAVSDDVYDGISETVSATTTDDDSPGMTVVESGGATSVSESGTTDDFTVVLLAQPSTAVSLTLTSSDTGEASVFPATLTFTNANWDTPQTATITGVDDDLIDGDVSTTVTIAVDAASSAPEYGTVTDEVVGVTTTDDDLAAFTIVESGAGTLVTEAGSTDDFTVVLDSEPASDVVFDITAGTPTEATVAPVTLTFTSANWDTPQTVTVTGVDDFVIDGNVSSTVTISVDAAASDDDFDAVAAQTVSVITTDDDAGGFTVEESDGTTVVNESGSTDDFTVVLTSQPASDVVFDVTSADTDEVTSAPLTLTFSTADWDTPQVVTVTGVDDLVDDGATATSVSIAVNAAASDDDFDALPAQIVSVTNNDDDTAGFTTTETSGGTLVSESGSTDTFDVVLDTEPLSDVVIDVSSGDLGEATVAPASLTFTSANWNVAQTVTVTGVDDLIDDDSQFTPVTLAVNDAASDDAYDAVLPRTVTVTTTDDDNAVGMTVTAIGGTTVTEAGGTDAFTVVLTSQPGTDVVITVTSGDLGEATALPSPLTFTAANWDDAQTVTVTGVDDDIIDGNQITQVTVAVDAANSDDAYDLVADEIVDVTTTDDDVAGFTLVESGGSTVVSENGSTDDITVVLDAEPLTDVVIAVSSANTLEATVAPAALTFTAANWDTPQTVTVTGVDDAVIDLNQLTDVTFSINAGASDDDFDLVADQVVSVTTTDDDAAGITLTPTDGSTIVSEAGSTDDFTVVLSSGPATNVTVTVTSGDTGEATVAPATLTFTPADWFTAQTVTVTGVDDAGVDGDQVTVITVAVDDATSDDAYDGISETLSATTTDDDGAGFTIVESDGTTEVSEPATTDDFTIVLLAQPATNVVLNITSDDLGESVPSPATITFTNANWATPQTITVTAGDDDLIDGVQLSTVTVAVDVPLSDAEYSGVLDGTVTVATVDDDIAGITIVETDGGTIVTEAGGTDTFSVVLDTEPILPVVLDVTSSDLGEATVAPAQLTFTGANWDTPQTVTVTGVDDAIIDSSQLSVITVSVDDAASDDSYDLVADATVSVTTADDDGATFIVTESGGDTFVTEAGGTDDFTVVLGAEPASDVVFDLVLSDATEASLSAASLTFTTANWDTPQTVTVTGVDDAVDDGSIVSSVTVSVNDAASDDDFDLLLDQSVTVTTIDDDVAGFTVVAGAPTVTEAGSTSSFTVVLDTEPISDVVFTVTSADVSEVTAAPATLTFTPVNWNVTQTVTLTGVDDLENDGNVLTSITISVNDGLSDDTYDPLPNQTVSVTTIDDDQAGFTITQTGGGTTVNESGSTDDFSVVLTAEPGSDVVLLVTSGDLSEVTAAPASLTFTAANWETPQVVTVTGVDDAFDDGDRFTLVTVSVDDANSDDAYDPLADQSVSVSTIDDDGVGFTVTESDGNSVVTEAGGTDDFTVVLDAEPVTDVVLDVTSADPGEVTGAPATLTFTSGNWDTPQTVTLTGIDDGIDDGDVITLVTISVDAANSDDAYDAVTPQNVGVTTTDDDDAGFSLAETGPSTSVTEAGSTDTFTAVLDVAPTADVILTVTSGDTGEATVLPTSLTFTTANWDTPQVVTVTGVDDLIADGDVIVTITVAVDDAASDDAFDALADQTIASTTVDDDIAGFTVVESAGTTVTEAGSTDTFTVTLLTQPTSNVVLDVSSADVGEATVNVSSLNFTPASWNTPQTVTVTGVNDALDDGDQTTLVTISVNDAASDDAYDAVADQTVSVTTEDDDGAGLTIVESGGNTSVNESGTTDEFTVALTAQPGSDVVLTIGSPDTGEVTVAPPTLTFTSVNWATPQPVTVTGVDDALVDGNIITAVVIAVDDANSDDAFDGVADVTVDVTTIDDDASGFSVTESGPGTTVSEAGGTDTFDVVLTAEPSSDVVFDLTSADPGEATLSSAQLTFTTANWDTPQTVTVTGVDDVIQDGPQVTVLTVAVNAGLSDDNFDALPAQTVDATTTDDDSAQYSVSDTGGSTSVDETGTTDAIAVVLGTEPSSNVVVTAVSGDTGEVTVSPAQLTFTPANWDTPQNFTVTGVDDSTVDGSQVTQVTVAIDDANSDDAFDPLADQSIGVTTTDDDVGSFTVAAGPGLTVSETGTTDNFTVVLDVQPLTNVVFEITSADAGEASVNPALMTFTAVNWATPQTVTVTGVDDAVNDGPQVTAITVAVSAPNSDDAFDALPSQQVNTTTLDDDSAGLTVVESGGTTAVSESGTTDTFTLALTAQPTSAVVIDVTSGDTGEVTALPAQVTFTPADWNFPQTITVTGVDDDAIDGPVVSSITLSINDAASDDTYDPVLDETVSVTTTDDDVAGFTVTETGATSVSEAGTTDNFTVVLDAEPSSDVVLTVVSADPGEASVDQASLTFTAANWDTPQTVTVTGVDDAIDDGDQNSTITIAVDDANSDDAFDALADQTVSVTTIDDDGAGFTLTESGGGTVVSETGTTDDFTLELTTEPASNVVLTVTSADLGEATVDLASVTFTPANWDTPQTVTVTGVDDLNDDGNQVTAVTISVDDANSDDAYDPVLNQIASVTTIDNDIAGFSIVQTGSGTLVSEAGTLDSMTVVLTAEPVDDVVLLVESQDITEATVDVASLTFTSADWTTPQTITVTGVDDMLLDGVQFILVSVAVDDANSDDAYDPLASQFVSVTVTDDDGAGYTVVESGGSTTVDESGTPTDDFTITLDAQPFGDVVLTISSSDTGEAVVSPTSVLFNNGDWDQPHTVTVTGVDDSVIDGPQASTVTISVNEALTENSFDAMPNQTVDVTTTDDDIAGFTILESGGFTSVSEAGSTDDFTVVLDVQPASNVVLDVSSPDLGEVTVGPASLVFTPVNWATPQTVTVTGVDDDIDDGDVVTAVDLSINQAGTDAGFDAVASQSVNTTTVDDDTAGFTVTESAGSTDVSESGSSDAFTVRLDAEPLTPVQIDIANPGTDEVTIDVATLTFTSLNWDTPQTVTAMGVDDDVADGDQPTSLSLAVNDGLSDDAFDGVADQTVIVTTEDDDVASFTIVESAGNTVVAESGTTDTFTVGIGAEPVTAVVIDVSSADLGEATVTPAQLTFTSANWMVAQTVTVTGIDDGDLVDGDIETTITVSVNDAGSDATYDVLTDQLVTVTTTDLDVAGYTVTPSGPGTTVGETVGDDSFTVVLDAQPVTAVVLDVTSGDLGEVAVTPGQLTFTNANWSTPQTVTVSGVDDDPLLDGDQTTIVTVSVNTIGSNDAFDGLADQTVTVTTTDEQVASFSTVQSGGSTQVDETGTTDNFTVVLDVQPTSNVVLTVSSADLGEVTVSPTTLTFTPGNWNTPRTVVLTGVGDSPLLDGDQVTLVTVAVDDPASYDPFDSIADQTVSVTTTDADAPGFTIVESAGTTSVDEGGSTDSFTVELDVEPATNVVLTVVSADVGEVTVSPATLTFTSGNWDTPQTVTVTGIDEGSLVDGTQTTLVTISVDAANSDDLFDTVADQAVSVETTDDDVAAFTVTAPGGMTVAEDGVGNTDTFTVELDAQPVSDVVITISSGSPGEAVGTPTPLTFTTFDWNVAQTVTVTGQDDSPLVDGDQISSISVGIDAGNSDDAWDALAAQPVSVTTTDTDIASFTIDESGEVTSVTEAAGGANSDGFTIVLDAQPTGPVAFTISSGDTGEALVAPTTLLFNSGNWNAAQTVTVTGVDDDVIDGDQNTTITVAINQAGTTPLFDGLANQTVSAATLDDDVAGFTIVESGGTTVTEAAGVNNTDTYTVVLDAEPASNVVISVVSANTAEVTVAPTPLTFTAGNWNTPQTVTVTGVDDAVDDGNQVTVITMAVVDASSDDDFDALANQTVNVTTVDDEAPGITVSPTSGLVTSENTDTATFDVVLDTEPTSDVTIALSSSDAGEGTVTAIPLTFTSLDWDTPQTVFVVGVDDGLIDGDIGYTILTAPATSADPSYSGMNASDVSVTNIDNDTPGIRVTLGGPSTIVSEGGSTATFDVQLNTMPATDVVLDVTADDPSEASVNVATLTFTSANWDTPQTVTVTGEDDVFADGDTVSSITVSVDDLNSDNDYDPVADELVSVTTTDDEVAGFTIEEIGGDTETDEDGAQESVTVVLTERPETDVTITITNPDPGEILVDQTTLTFTTNNWDQLQTIFITGVDDSPDDDGDTVTIITFSVAPSSPAPFAALPDQTVSATNLDLDPR